jgi:mRNA-degrading endonuclease RelE of RelBE toxin-antitoxin system
MTRNKYDVLIKRKVARGLGKLPANVQKLFYLLVADLQADGPVQKSWHNYSPLGNDRHHCHLNYRYVACWTCRKHAVVVEVYYAGSREKAPY